MSMNPRNLYLLSKLELPDLERKSLFQRKWIAKRETRKYHGHFLPERVLDTIFDGKLRGVAGSDPSEVHKIPLASQMYANMERRLDIAVFRALFATSPLQAANNIRHGRVKLNGKKFVDPSYLLNPGDLFEVDSKTVLRNIRIEKKQKNNRTLRPHWFEKPFKVTGSLQRGPQIEEPELIGSNLEIHGLDSNINSERKLVEHIKSQETPDVQIPDSPYSTLDSTYSIPSSEHDAVAPDGISPHWRPETTEEPEKPKYKPEIELRPFLSPFAFIPNYLEVSHDVCAAVYLRHPVATVGETEVPSPYPPELHALTYNYYIRKRK